MCLKIRGLNELKLPFAVLLAMGLVCLPFISSNAVAQTSEAFVDVELSIKPDRCVALREGQDCYQGLVIRWSGKAVGHYCLLEGVDKKMLKCWEESKTGVLKYDFQASKSTSFSLVVMPEGNLIASTTMQVSWVYKARKRQRMNWRLF